MAGIGKSKIRQRHLHIVVDADTPLFRVDVYRRLHKMVSESGKLRTRQEPPDLVYPVIPLMELHTRVVPYLWFIENERP